MKNKKEISKKPSAKVYLLILVIALFIIFYNRQTKQEPTTIVNNPILTLEPSSKTVKVGDQFLVNVYAKNFINLKGVQLSFTFNPDVLKYNRVVEGNFLNRNNVETFFFDINSSTKPGLIKDIVIVRKYNTVNGDGLFASLYFDAIGDGKSELNFGEILIADDKGNIIRTETINSYVKVIP